MLNEEKVIQAVRDKIKELGMNKTEFASRCGCSQQQVNQVFGTTPVIARKIASFIGYEKGWIKK